MPRINKYCRRRVIGSLDELARWLSDGGWIYYHQKLMHPLFASSMTFYTLMRAVENRSIISAMINPEYKSKEKSDAQVQE